jgi:hypothetical protein
MARDLFFIHITKTAGTAIEDIGRENGVKWGRFSKVNIKYNRMMTRSELNEFFHIPFCYVSNINELKKKYDFFAIVRDPYDRCISEIYWWYQIILKEQKDMSLDELNNNICHYIKDHKDVLYGHWIPQYKYIYDNTGVKLVDHVLKFEDLPNNFNQLMVKYNLKIKLDRVINKSNKAYSVKDLYPETLKLIETYYLVDFEKFGYNFYTPVQIT